MCGRYTLTADISFLQARFGLEVVEVPFTPRYNISPTQDVFTVLKHDGEKEAHMMRWGLIPHWAKDLSIGSRMINARAETLAESKVFSSLFRRHRCLVIADGFYEWRKLGNKKVPMRITLKSGEPFSFAGLWSSWSPRGRSIDHILSCTIITTAPNRLMEPIHNRMPVMLSREAETAWLDPALVDTAELRELLLPYDAGEMEAYEVSALVNSPRNEDPACIARAK